MCARSNTQIVQTPNGREFYGMEDKAVSTSDDLIAVLNIGSGDDGGGDEITTWNASTVDKLLATLMRTKLMSIRERPPLTTDTSDSEKSSYSWPNDVKDKEPPDKKYGSDRRRQQRQSSSSPRPHHHYHHHHHHRCAKQVQLEEQQQRTSISKVQKWSDDLDMETSFDNKYSEDETAQPFQERVDERTKLTTSRTYASTAAPKRKGDAHTKHTTSGKRKKRRRKSQRSKKLSQIDAEDLPKRARWTIAITSGLLILTCMLLVGITLRMAPVIDQMVRTKNEELMNSLNRENAPVRYYSTDT